MNEMRHINSYLLRYLKQKYEIPWNGDFSAATKIQNRYLNTSSKQIASSSAYNLYFIKIPRYAKYLNVTHVKISSNLYGMGFTKNIGNSTEAVLPISCYNRLNSPVRLPIPSNANYFVISAVSGEISRFSYSFES